MCAGDHPGNRRWFNNFKKCKTLVERFREEFGGVTCSELQKQFTGKTYDMWNAEAYKAFDEARGKQCAHATGKVTQWVIAAFDLRLSYLELSRFGIPAVEEARHCRLQVRVGGVELHIESGE